MRNKNEVGSDRRSFLTKVAAGILGAKAIEIGPGVSEVSAWTGEETNSVLNQARTDSSPLRIRNVTPYILRLEKDAGGKLAGVHYVVCRIDTEDGLSGWGDGSSWPNVVTIASEIEMAKRYLIGQGAWNIEAIWNGISIRRTSSHGASVQSCISAVDIALWDIVGQHLNVPVYRLLGGKVNERIKIYTYFSGAGERTAKNFHEKTKELMALGAVAAKWDPFTRLEPSRAISLQNFNEVVEMVRGAREAGPNFEIGIEGHAKLNVPSAIRMAKALEPFNVMFYEEPVMPESAAALRQVQQSTSVPVAIGERIKSRFEMREYLEMDAFRILQPDVVRCGGITELRKMVAMIETHLLPFAPHNPNSPVSTAAHLHLATSSASFMILEQGFRNPEVYKELIPGWQDSYAYWMAPEIPGLGVKFSDAFIRDHSVPIDKAERG